MQVFRKMSIHFSIYTILHMYKMRVKSFSDISMLSNIIFCMQILAIYIFMWKKHVAIDNFTSALVYYLMHPLINDSYSATDFQLLAEF